VIVLKPAALGGPLRALALARRARDAGCRVFVTSLLDSAIGVAAAVHVAAALPSPRPADGLATGALFETDVAPPPAIAAGRLVVPDAPGLGVAPDAERLGRLAAGAPRTVRA